MPKGVAFNAPPEEYLPSIMAGIDKAIAALPPEANGAVVLVADLAGINGAVVAKVGDKVKVKAWIGKEWKGPLDAGVSVLVTL